MELLIFGLVTGFISGFFGLGGGAILTPALIVIGFTMKEAVSVSIMQMVFSSIYGSFINSFIAPVQEDKQIKEKSKLTLIFIGFFVGVIAMSIGVGGAIMLIPLLVSFMKYPFKIATSLSLFFVIFSSISGFISLCLNGDMLLKEGLVIGLASLVGVFFGIKMKNIVGVKSYKKYILVMYFIVLAIMIYKTIF